MSQPRSIPRSSPRPAPWKRPLAALAVFVAALGYFALFRDYGFQVEDEGTLLFQLDRAARGEYPYVDFHTGYTPGFFAIGSAVLRAVGFQVESLRAVLSILNAGTAAALYLFAAPIVGGFLAVASPLAFVLFLPVWPGDFAAFNVPYPAWPATAAWVAAALAMASWTRRGGSVLPFVAGAVAGVAFAIKPNAGAFALAASTWTIAMVARHDGTLDRLASIAASTTMLLGVWFAFGLTVASMDAAVHLPPCIALAALAAGPARGFLATGRHPRALPALALLAAGFAIPTLAWAIPVLGRLGIDGFARDVLLIGSGAADLYYLEHPAPGPYALAVTVATLAIALAGRAVATGRLAPTLPFALLAFGTFAGAAALHFLALAPEGFRRSILWELENAGFWLAPLANYGGVALLARRTADLRRSVRRRLEGDASVRALAALVPMATAMYLQLFPRTDFMHLLMGVPITFVLALALLRRVASWWSRGPWPAWTRGRHVVGAFLATVFFLVFGLRLGVDLEPLGRVAARYDVSRPAVESPRATLWAESQSADDLIAFGKAASWLSARIQPGEPLLAFPATSGLLFLTGATSPVPHDYWYPGRPDHDDEARMLATLAASPPRYIATLNEGWTFFIGSTAYFTEAREFACSRYRLAARFGRFDILELRHGTTSGAAAEFREAPRTAASTLGATAAGPAAAAERPAPAGSGPTGAGVVDEAPPPVETWQPTGGPDDVPRPEIAARRQAVRRWLADLRPPRSVAEARLPSSRAEAVLFLRALRDAGDPRATAWLLAGYTSGDDRLRRESINAMDMVAQSFEATSLRWACDFDPLAFRPFVEPFEEGLVMLRDHGDPRARPFAEAALSLIARGALVASAPSDEASALGASSASLAATRAARTPSHPPLVASASAPRPVAASVR